METGLYFVGFVSLFHIINGGSPLKNASKECILKDQFAVCELEANPNKPSSISGILYFMQTVNSDCTFDFLNIQANIYNISTDDGNSKHGLHVHEYGVTKGGCEAMGQHYNPLNSTHGSPWHPVNSRHVGDFGNVEQSPKDGSVETRIVDYMASLIGPQSIVGRGVVLHAKTDDLGMNTNDIESLKTGNAGARLACCVIGRSPPLERNLFSLYG